MEPVDFLLINPWIYDFAAFDLWIKPIGLYHISETLSAHGFSNRVLDCLDEETFSGFDLSGFSLPKKNSTREGKLLKQAAQKPDPLKDIRRKYSSYGLWLPFLKDQLKTNLQPRAVMVTSMMTYWYPAVFETVQIIKEVFPGIPVILGGIYATLCRDHALKYSGADLVVSGPLKLPDLRSIAMLAGLCAKACIDEPGQFQVSRLNRNKKFAVILTSRGCPYQCPYCASNQLHHRFIQRTPESVLEEIEYYVNECGIRDFTFYDDALLVNAKTHMLPILKGTINRGLDLRFHVPNGVHLRSIDGHIADTMRRAGFRTLRFGFEYSDRGFQAKDGKITNPEFEEKIGLLKRAGFSDADIGINVMAGLPGQRFEHALDTVKYVQDAGVRIYVSEYSPIPGTGLWDRAVMMSKYALEREPLFHNNSIFPCEWEGFTLKQLNSLKIEARKSGRSHDPV